MSPPASLLSTTSTIAGYVRKIGHSRPGVEVVIDDHTPDKVYTTFDAVTGLVNITAPQQNVRFDEVRITLQGLTKTFVENMSPSGSRSRGVARHNFLRLVMPLRDADYPQPRVAEAGRTYTFPFNFNIPEHLLPRSCGHSVDSEHVGYGHLQLPPSLEGRDLAGLDDLAPDMSKISYVVKAEVVRTGGDEDKVLVEGLKKLRVVPAVAEAPPLSLADGDPDYVLTKTKSLRKGVFSGTLGRITVSAAQTRAVMLPPPRSPPNTSAITTATLYLRFYPSGTECEPPKLGGITTKIKATTFFAVRPIQTLPSIARQSQYEGTRSLYSTSVHLSSRCVESVSWAKHEPHPPCMRRDSESTTSSDASGSSILDPVQKEGMLYYTAKVIVPITLPSSKNWVPTFHSCLTSRIYTLDLSLTIHTPGTGVPATSLSLHLPVQIASAGHAEGRAQLTADEAAAELASANEFFVPRLMEVPSESYIGNSILQPAAPAPRTTAGELPPTYDERSKPRTIAPGKC